MAAKIKETIGIESELVKGKDGVFEVSVGDEIIFSKRKERRFPTEEEIIEKLRAMT